MEMSQCSGCGDDDDDDAIPLPLVAGDGAVAAVDDVGANGLAGTKTRKSTTTTTTMNRNGRIPQRGRPATSTINATSLSSSTTSA